MSENYSYKEQKAMDTQLNMDNWSVWNSKFLDRVAGCNGDLLHTLRTGTDPAELIWDRLDPKTKDNRPRFHKMLSVFEKDGITRILVKRLDNKGVQEVDKDGVPRWERMADDIPYYSQDDEGRSIYTSDLMAWETRVRRLKEAKTSMTGLLLKSVTEIILSHMKMNIDYESHAEKANIYMLYELARHASTGQGEHSLYLDIMKLIELKIVNEDHVEYCTKYNACLVRLRASKKTDKELLEHLLKSFYYMGLRPSKKLERYLQDMIASGDWAPVEKSMKEFNTLLTARRTLGMDGNTSNKNGELQANEAALTATSLKKVLDDRDAAYGLQAFAAYKAKGSKKNLRKWICFNCAKMVEHGWRTCPEKKVQCGNCSKMHNTLCHDEIEKKDLLSKTRVPAFNRKRPGFGDGADKQAYQFSVNEAESMESQDEDYIEYLQFCEDTDLRSNMTRFTYEEAVDIEEEQGTLMMMHAMVSNVDNTDSNEGGSLTFDVGSEVDTETISESIADEEMLGECTSSKHGLDDTQAIDIDIVSNKPVVTLCVECIVTSVSDVNTSIKCDTGVDEMTRLQAKLKSIREMKAASEARIEDCNRRIAELNADTDSSRLTTVRLSNLQTVGMITAEVETSMSDIRLNTTTETNLKERNVKGNKKRSGLSKFFSRMLCSRVSKRDVLSQKLPEPPDGGDSNL